jgi:hypothetical protein
VNAPQESISSTVVINYGFNQSKEPTLLAGENIRGRMSLLLLLWIESGPLKNSWIACPIVTPGGHILISVPMKAVFG